MEKKHLQIMNWIISFKQNSCTQTLSHQWKTKSIKQSQIFPNSGMRSKAQEVYCNLLLNVCTKFNSSQAGEIFY